jgi:hypothetical protein
MGLSRSVHVTSINSLDGVELVAIAVYPGGTHIGILHREKLGSPLTLTHLCAHNALVNAPADSRQCVLWIALEIDVDEAEQVAAACRLVARKWGRNEFPYAFSSPDGFFDRSMSFNSGPGRLGLTCATFVLGIFNAVAIDIASYGSWPKRPSDTAWRNHIFGQVGMSPELIAAVQKETIMSARYQPLEVAGAAAHLQYPARFRGARKQGRRIRSLLAAK